MTEVVQLVVSGLENGISYSLVGLALVLIYQTSAALNFAQGTMAAISGFVAYEIVVANHLPWVLGALAGILCERSAVINALRGPSRRSHARLA